MYLEAARYLMREAIRDDERHPATITVSHLIDSPNSIHLSQSDEIRRNLSQLVPSYLNDSPKVIEGFFFFGAILPAPAAAASALSSTATLR